MDTKTRCNGMLVRHLRSRVRTNFVETMLFKCFIWTVYQMFNEDSFNNVFSQTSFSMVKIF